LPSAPVEDLSDEESGDIPFRDAPEEAPNADKEAEEEEEEEEEDNDEEDDGV
jgi:chromobox protein 1